MQLVGFKVGETEKAIHFVAAVDAATAGIRGLYLALSKIEWVESDGKSVEIQTKDAGLRVGFPGTITINDEYAAKIKLI